LPDGATFVGAAATDVFLDGVERSDMFERFAGDRRRTGSCKFIEATPYMRPAKREPDVARVGGFAVAGITVDLQDTLEAFKMGDGPFGFAVGRIASPS
jgi:hypothetical protein